jgi:hypothetical protein
LGVADARGEGLAEACGAGLAVEAPKNSSSLMNPAWAAKSLGTAAKETATSAITSLETRGVFMVPV